jgi:hypothetical protein
MTVESREELATCVEGEEEGLKETEVTLSLCPRYVLSRDGSLGDPDTTLVDMVWRVWAAVFFVFFFGLCFLVFRAFFFHSQQSKKKNRKKKKREKIFQQDERGQF